MRDSKKIGLRRSWQEGTDKEVCMLVTPHMTRAPFSCSNPPNWLDDFWYRCGRCRLRQLSSSSHRSARPRADQRLQSLNHGYYLAFAP